MTALPSASCERVIGRIATDRPYLFAVLTKRTFVLSGGAVKPAERQEPILDESVVEQAPETGVPVPNRMPEGTPERIQCDLVVLATARSARPVREASVVLRGPGFTRRLIVRGDRRAVRRGNGWTFSEPESWEEMPLGWDRAYGGVDRGVLPRDDAPLEEKLQSLVVHPGAYPRNDLGRGYALAGSSTPPDDAPLPNLEDPEDLLSPDRLVCRERAFWHIQPRPAGFGFVLPHWFTRSIHVGVVAGAWPNVGRNPLPEETLGLLPAGFLERQRSNSTESPAISGGHFQVAAPGMKLTDPEGTERFEFEGLETNRRFVVTLPGGRPVVRVRTPKKDLFPTAKLLQVLIDFHSGVLTMLWSSALSLEEPLLANLPKKDLADLPFDSR